MAINEIRNNGCKCITIGNLPSSYLLSLSYEEQLLWLCNFLDNTLLPTINECIKIVNNIDVNFDEIRENITTINNEISIINDTINSLKEEIYSNVDNKLAQQYNNIVRLMDDYQTLFNNRLTLMYETLENEITQIQLGNVNAYDPTTGTIVPVSVALQNIYDATRYNAISCSEYDGLDLTANQFEAYDITAYNFDLNAKAILI